MRVELLPGMDNVVRFPVERRARPTLPLLREMAPDVREVLAIAEAFGMDGPVHDLRERADAETAVYIARHVPAHGPERQALLAEMIDPLVGVAIAACRDAHEVSLDASAARQGLPRAKTAGHSWLEPLRERAEALTQRAARLLLAAHARVEETEGVARAVSLARSGEPWSPRDRDAEDEALLAVSRRVG